MRITQILSQYRNDFTAMMVCEHCGHTEKLDSGYDDRHYFEKVIPAMHCKACLKNRAGEVKEASCAS